MNKKEYVVEASPKGRLVRSGLALALLSALALGAPALADYPQPEDLRVNDFADLIRPATEERIRARFLALREEHGVEAVVVTVESWDDYATDARSFEEFATGLFDYWGIGDRERNDGLLLLVARADRKVRIEVGSGYGSTKDGAMKRVIDRVLVPRLVTNDFSRGLEEGAEAMIEAALRTPEADASAEGAASSHTAGARALTTEPSGSRGEGRSWPLIAGILALASGAVAGVRLWSRRRPRACPSCGGRMERLSELDEDEYLDSGRQAEENIGSVDYDVWLCARCEEHTVHRYAKWKSGISTCPSCMAKTVDTTKVVTVDPTRYETGERRVETSCLHCDYQEVRFETIPMLTDSSYSSDASSDYSSGYSGGDSFGGGSSSGGGASGDW